MSTLNKTETFFDGAMFTAVNGVNINDTMAPISEANMAMAADSKAAGTALDK